MKIRYLFAAATFSGTLLGLAVACSSSNEKGGGAAVVDAGLADASSPVFAAVTEAGSTSVIRFGEAGAPTACKAHPSPDSALVRTCVLRTSCTFAQGHFTMSDCISQNSIDYDEHPDCVRAAATCEAMAKCLDNTYLYGETCAFGERGKQCHGEKLVNCNQEPITVTDCEKIGMHCVGDAGGTDVACLPTLEVQIGACEEAGSTKSEAVCVDGGSTTYFGYCQYGRARYVDCGSIDEECFSNGDTISCRAKGSATCAADVSVCVDNTLGVCVNASRLEIHDCANAGLKCVSTGVKADCIHPDCTPETAASCKESCDGPFANVCVGGGRLAIDCRDYGMKRCQAFTSTAPEFQGDYVKCVPF